MRLLKLLLIMFVCAAGPASAGPIEDVQEALNKRDFATALRMLRPLAEQGNGEAQNLLGGMYVYGNGVLQDYVQGAYWYRRAAEQGDAFAQSNLADRYWFGEGAPRDYVQAYKWKNLAAVGFDAIDPSGRSQFDPYRGAKFFRDDAMKKRNEIAAGMTPAQIAEAQKLARV